jgi:hypothetical protein
MNTTNKIRIATADTTDACTLACSEVTAAVGRPVQAEFQEIEGGCLILELRLGDEALHPSRRSRSVPPPPARVATAVDIAAPTVEVLSAWHEPVPGGIRPKLCHHVLGSLYDDMPPVAHRALTDNLATAVWDRSDFSWHLAVPSSCATQPIVGLSHRRGYTHRFTSLEAASIRSGLAS